MAALSGTHPWRVLQVHNRYQQRGGEDAVADAEAELLAQHGHVVHRLLRHNDEIRQRSPLSVAIGAIDAQDTHRALRELAISFRPDVVHVHNFFPLVSPGVFRAAASLGLPTVLTLHNFRLLCPQAMLLREGRVCEDCVGRVPWRGVLRRCYRGSAAQTAVVAAQVQWHRWTGTWRQHVHRYIALNEFCRDKFVAGGLPAERISVKPNFIDLPVPDEAERDGLLFVGRLSAEKGVRVLADAMRLAPPELACQVIGDGPERSVLDSVDAVRILGALPPDEVYARMRRAHALVLPSICYENHPRTLVEAFACGLPVIASRLGALASLVDEGSTGLLFEPGNPADLAAKLAWLQQHPLEARRMGRAARAHYVAAWTPTANHDALIDIYAAARDTAARR